MELIIRTDQNRQVVDITDEVQKLVKSDASLCIVFVAHTTASVTTADLDPGTDLDLLDAVWEMIPSFNTGIRTILPMCRHTWPVQLLAQACPYRSKTAN